MATFKVCSRCEGKGTIGRSIDRRRATWKSLATTAMVKEESNCPRCTACGRATSGHAALRSTGTNQRLYLVLSQDGQIAPAPTALQAAGAIRGRAHRGRAPRRAPEPGSRPKLPCVAHRSRNLRAMSHPAGRSRPAQLPVLPDGWRLAKAQAHSDPNGKREGSVRLCRALRGTAPRPRDLEACWRLPTDGAQPRLSGTTMRWAAERGGEVPQPCAGAMPSPGRPRLAKTPGPCGFGGPLLA